MKTGSQDISPPKDTDNAAQPAQQPKTDPTPSDSPGGAVPEEALPDVMTESAAVSTQEAAAEPVTEVSYTSEGPGVLLAMQQSCQSVLGCTGYGKTRAPFLTVNIPNGPVA